MLSSGSLPFYSIFDSDHHPYYNDTNSKLLFSDSAHDIAPKFHRLLWLQDPKITEKYRSLVHEQFQLHKVYDKLNDLKSHADNATWQQSHTEQYQVLDNVITDAMLYAEKQIGKQYSATFDWSPKLKEAVQVQRYWYLKLKQVKGLPVSPTGLDFHCTVGNIQVDKEMSLPQVLHHLRSAKALLRTYQKEHKTLRASYLEDLAEAIFLHSTPSLSFDSMTTVKNVRKERERTKTTD